MSLFTSIQRSFEARRATGELDRALGHWAHVATALSLFGDAEELICAVGRARDCESAGDELADATLVALCAQASRRGGRLGEGGVPGGSREEAPRDRIADDAALLLLWLFLPQLWGTSFANPGGALDRDDLEAEMALGLWEAIVAVAPGHVGVRRRLVHGARETARAAARRALDYERRCRSLEAAERIPALNNGTRFADPDGVLAVASELEVVNHLEGRLVLETRLDGQSLDEAARALGLSAKAAELRRTRAEARLSAWLRDQPVPPRRKANARSRYVPGHLNTAALDLETASGTQPTGHQGGDERHSPRSPSPATPRTSGSGVRSR